MFFSLLLSEKERKKKKKFWCACPANDVRVFFRKKKFIFFIFGHEFNFRTLVVFCVAQALVVGKFEPVKVLFFFKTITF